MVKTRQAVPALVILGACTLAPAQRLDLGGGGGEPRPGDGVGALALAEKLEKENVRGTGRVVRSLAAALLRSGENAGSAGAEAVLAGLTLASKREAIDALLAQAAPGVREIVAGVAGGGAPSVAVRDVDLLLRDALGPLVVQVQGRCGWAVVGGEDAGARLVALAGRLDMLIESRRVEDSARGPLREMRELLHLAPEHPAYVGSALEWAGLIDSAADAIGEPPAWLDMPARDRLRTDFSSGALLCIDKPGEARVILGRTAAVMRVVRAVDGLPAALQSRELRDAVNRLASAGEGDALRDAAAVGRVEAVFTRAVGLLGAGGLVSDRNRFVRQVRPMLDPLLEAHRRDAEALARLLPSIVGSPDPMTDPAVVAGVSAASRSGADLGMPARLTDLLTHWPQGVSEPVREPSREPLALRATTPLADRVRVLGVALAKPESADAAIASLREIDGVASALLRFPGERELLGGAHSTAWQRVTGGEVERLTRAVDQARAGWLRAESTDQFGADRGPARARVRVLERALPLLRDAAAFEELRLDMTRSVEPACNAWPGVELTGAGVELLAQGLTAESAKLAEALASGGDAESLCDALARSHAAALALGRVEGLAQGLKLGGCDAATELGTGPPAANAWLVEHRHALAQVCRWAFEGAAGDGERRAMFLAQANRAGAPVVGVTPAR